jgi:hypothetical protein
MNKIKWHYVNERSFKQVKAMLNAEVPINAIVKLTGRGYPTIRNIKNVKDFDAYKEYRTQVAEKTRQRRAQGSGGTSFLRRVFSPSNSPLEAEIAKAREALSNIEHLVQAR